MTPSIRVRATLLAGLGLLLLQLGWIISIVPDYGIDEFDHSLRASSVASGHWRAGHDLAPQGLGRGDLVPVRADVARTVGPACRARSYTGLYNCTPKRHLSGDEVQIASGASRYNPAYYAYAGTLAKPFHGTANLFALRIVTALAACALFLLTVWLAAGGARTRWPVFACLVAVLPTTVYSTSITSPNGIELMAGLASWVALLTLVRGPRGLQRRGTAYAVAAFSTAVLVNTHTLGVFWLGLMLVAIAILHGPGRTVRALLPRSAREGVMALGAIAAIGFELVWLVASGANDPSLERQTFDGSPVPFILRGIVLWPLQAIGAFPMRDQPAPLAVFGLVLAVIALIAVPTWRRTALRSRTALALAFVGVLSWAIPAVLTAYSFHQIGAAWQGRYGMPFSVGLLVIAATVLDETEPSRRITLLLRGATVVLVAAQLLSQLKVIDHERRLTGLVGATGWHAPNVALLCLLSVSAALCWATAVAAGPSRTADTDAGVRELAGARR